jgi:hypothetical protein
MTSIKIGHLLRAGITGFVVGCSVSQSETPSLGDLVLAPLETDYSVFGLVTGISIEDDGLVRQLVTTGDIKPEVLRDNRERRIVPVEVSVLAVGCESAGRISHNLPPRPPLSLDVIYLCSDPDVIRFTSAGHFGYFRHILQARDIPTGEVLAAHLQKVVAICKDETWVHRAARELVTLLRDDYPALISVLGALGDALPA